MKSNTEETTLELCGFPDVFMFRPQTSLTGCVQCYACYPYVGKICLTPCGASDFGCSTTFFMNVYHDTLRPFSWYA